MHKKRLDFLITKCFKNLHKFNISVNNFSFFIHSFIWKFVEEHLNEIFDIFKLRLWYNVIAFNSNIFAILFLTVIQIFFFVLSSEKLKALNLWIAIRSWLINNDLYFFFKHKNPSLFHQRLNIINEFIANKKNIILGKNFFERFFDIFVVVGIFDSWSDLLNFIVKLFVENFEFLRIHININMFNHC